MIKQIITNSSMMKKISMSIFFFLIFTTLLCAQKNDSHSDNSNSIENYQDVKIRKYPIAIQLWSFRKFSFYESLQKTHKLGIKFVEAYPGQKLGSELPGVKFSHNLSNEHLQLVKKWLNEFDINLINYGVVKLVNNVDSLNKIVDFTRALGIETIVAEPQFDDFSSIEKMAKNNWLRIAIHNHPVPSKYALPETVLKYVHNLDKSVGACADIGHWMRAGINPVEAAKLLNGRILDVHLKDRTDFGIENAEDVPVGEGIANIREFLAELTIQDYKGYLTIEYENKEQANNPMPALRKSIDYINSIADYEYLLKNTKRITEKYTKRGWNHFGPGYFTLDKETGELETIGGGGLFWYSRKKYSNFVLELDFKSSMKTSNSGIFLRTPALMLSEDDFIHNSFEVQIDNGSSGIHSTGAIYDAVAPSMDASNPIGEWNHYKITCVGKNIKVELNGQRVIDWDAKPTGKVFNYSSDGYIGLQNHDRKKIAPVYFKNIVIKEIK